MADYQDIGYDHSRNRAKLDEPKLKMVALVDLSWEGHHSAYLRFFSEALLQLGCRVVAFCPEPELLTTMLATQPEPGHWWAVRYTPSGGFSPGASRLQARAHAFKRLEDLADLLAVTERTIHASIDLVFFCFIDSFLGHWQSAAKFASRLGRPFSGLYFHPVHLRARVPHMWLRRGFLSPDVVLGSPCCCAVAVLDEGIADKLSRRIGGKRVVSFPDPAVVTVSDTPSPLELQINEKAQGRKVIGLIGGLEKRKGLLDFIQHAAALEDQPLFFVAAGKCYPVTFSEEEKRIIKRLKTDTPHNCFFLPEQIEDGTPFNGLVRRCDLLYAVYRDFPHSSNLLTKSAAMHVPIVVSDRYLMGERVRRFSLGFTVREDVPEDFRTLITSGKVFSWQMESQFKVGCAVYLEQHSPGRLVDGFQQILTCLD
jgi:glycosyltransferase involved in cell wall biosynthesis